MDPERLAIKMLDHLSLGRLVCRDCFHGDMAAMRQAVPDFEQVLPWSEAHGENFETAKAAARLVGLHELPRSLTAGLDIDPSCPDHVAWFIGFVIGSLRPSWRQMTPVLWVELLFWFTGLCLSSDSSLCGKVFILSTSIRARLLDGFKQARKDKLDRPLSSACAGARKGMERALGYLNLIREAGDKAEWLGPSAGAAVWSMPEPARALFRIALQKLESPPSRADLKDMRKRSLGEPEDVDQGSSSAAPELALGHILKQAYEIIKTACLSVMVVLLPRPPPFDPKKARSFDERGSCANCTNFRVDPIIRALARAWYFFRKHGERLSPELRALVLSTLPQGP